MPKNELDLRREFEPLSSDRLRALLDAETEKAVPDDDIVLAILHILEDRESEDLLPASTKEEAAWKLYRKRVRARKWKQPRRWTGLANAAALLLVVGLLFTVVPQEAGAESLWDVLVRWTHNAVDFLNPTENKIKSPFVFETDNPAMQQIYDEAVKMGIEQPLIPTWFPEEYVLDKIEILNSPKENCIFVRLISDPEVAIFQVCITEKDILHGYFGEEEWYQQFEREGAKYKTIRNNDRWTAVWIIDNKIEYSVALDCQEETLLRILDSIYVMEG